jgi:nitrate reductase NapD
MNVSSIVVKTTPENMKEVIERINSYDLCEVHFKDPDGRIVVTIEGESIDAQTKSLGLIQKIPNVLGANLVFSYCEEELTEALDRINRI